MLRIVGKILIGLGAAGLVGATIWWYMFFEQMLGQSVKRASECFYSTTTECEIGNLIGKFGDVPAYTPAALWISLGVFNVGLIAFGFSSRRDSETAGEDDG